MKPEHNTEDTHTHVLIPQTLGINPDVTGCLGGAALAALPLVTYAGPGAGAL